MSDEHAYRLLPNYDDVYLHTDAWDFASRDNEFQTALRRLPWLGDVGRRTWRFEWTGEYVEDVERGDWFEFTRR